MAIRTSTHSPAVSPGMAARPCHIAGSAPRADELTEAVTFHLATAARVRGRRSSAHPTSLCLWDSPPIESPSQHELNLVALLPSVDAGRYSTLSLRSCMCALGQRGRDLAATRARRDPRAWRAASGSAEKCWHAPNGSPGPAQHRPGEGTVRWRLGRHGMAGSSGRVVPTHEVHQLLRHSPL